MISDERMNSTIGSVLSLTTHNSLLLIDMPFVAKHRFARIAPRKARLLMDLIRNRDVDDAITMLRFSKQRAAVMIEKVVRSAVANASEQEVATSRNTSSSLRSLR